MSDAVDGEFGVYEEPIAVDRLEAKKALHDGSGRGWPIVPLWGIGALTVFSAGATTAAFQSLFGLAGIGFATVLFLMLAGPDYIATHSLLLPQPWPRVDPRVPHGAATSAVVSVVYFGAYTVVKPVLILAAWSVLTVAITVLARREHARE